MGGLRRLGKLLRFTGRRTGAAVEPSGRRSTSGGTAAFMNPLTPTCGACRKEIGLEWHYDFESTSLAPTVAAQCPQCGRYTCLEHLAYGPDGHYPACKTCGTTTEILHDGPASAPKVRQALGLMRYWGVMKSPSAQGRPVVDD